MTSRIGRHAPPVKRVAPARRHKGFVPADEERNPDPGVALTYADGHVTVEISQAALEAYIDLTGDVPLPVAEDPETGDRRSYDALNNVRVVYDARGTIREISTRSADGLFVRINFTD